MSDVRDFQLDASRKAFHQQASEDSMRPSFPDSREDTGLFQQACARLILALTITTGLSFVVWFHWVLVMRLPGP